MSWFPTVWLAAIFAGCATAPSAQTTATAPNAPSYRLRPGRIESIDPVVEHVPSDVVDDAFIGLVVGGLLFGNLVFHHGTGSVVGIDNDAWPRTTPDGESSRVPRYRVVVRFDDGGSMILEYLGAVPVDRGERVALTASGSLKSL